MMTTSGGLRPPRSPRRTAFLLVFLLRLVLLRRGFRVHVLGAFATQGHSAVSGRGRVLWWLDANQGQEHPGVHQSGVFLVRLVNHGLDAADERGVRPDDQKLG